MTDGYFLPYTLFPFHMNQSFKISCCHYSLPKTYTNTISEKNMNFSIFSSFLNDISKCITFIPMSIYIMSKTWCFSFLCMLFISKVMAITNGCPKKSNWWQKGPEMNPMGQYVSLGTSKWVIYTPWGFQTCMLKNIHFGCMYHTSSHRSKGNCKTNKITILNVKLVTYVGRTYCYSKSNK